MQGPEERDASGLEKRPAIPIPSRRTVEMLLDFARTGRESARTLAPGKKHPISERAEVTVPNQRVVLELSDHLKTNAVGSPQGALRGGTYLPLVVEQPHNLEVLTLRQWFLDVDDAVRSQHPARLGERP